jgi:hypothetical protein
MGDAARGESQHDGSDASPCTKVPWLKDIGVDTPFRGSSSDYIRHSEGASATEESLRVGERFLAALGMTEELRSA